MKEESIVARHYASRFDGLACVKYIGDKPKEAYIKQINVGSEVYSVSFSPDGTRVLSGSWKGVRVWDVVSGELVFDLYQGLSFSVAFSNDGKYIASGNYNGTIGLWNAATGESIHGALEGHTDQVNCVAFSPDSRYIASGSYDRTVRIWDVEKGSAIGEPLQGHSDRVRVVIFSPNGIYFASSSYGEIIVRDVESREMTYPPLKNNLVLSEFVFSHDSSKIVSGCFCLTIQIWEVSTGTMLHEFPGSEFGDGHLLARPPGNSHILVGFKDGIMRIWDIEDNKILPKLFRGHADDVTSASYSPDGTRFVSGSKGGTIRVWDAGGGQTETVPSDEMTAVGVSIDGKCLVTVSQDGTVIVWSAETGEVLKGPFQGRGWMTSLAFTSDKDEYRFASGFGWNVLIWELNGEPITCQGHSSIVFSVCFSPDGRHVASGSWDNTIRVWDSQNGLQALDPLVGHESVVFSVCYSGDGTRIVSGSADGTVRIWDSSNGSLLFTLEGYSPISNSIACSHNGSLIIFGDDRGIVQVWDVKSNNLVHELTGAIRRVIRLCFSSDDAWIASSSVDRSISVWNALTGSLFSKTLLSVSLNYIAFLPSTDPKYIRLASASSDGLIRIWCLDVGSQETAWILKNDGWLTGNDGNLLFWVPSDLRSTLITGPCTRIFNCQFSTKLLLSEHQGTSWTTSRHPRPRPAPTPHHPRPESVSILRHPSPEPHQTNCILAFYTRFILPPFIRLFSSSD